MLRGLLLDKAHLQTAACLTLACICLGTLSLGGTALPHGSLIPLVPLFDDATILRQVFLSAQLLCSFPFVSVCVPSLFEILFVVVLELRLAYIATVCIGLKFIWSFILYLCLHVGLITLALSQYYDTVL